MIITKNKTFPLGGIGVILSKDRLSSSGNSSKDLNKLNITFIDHDAHTLDTTDIALCYFFLLGFNTEKQFYNHGSLE